jgi:hypothetical protein
MPSTAAMRRPRQRSTTSRCGGKQGKPTSARTGASADDYPPVAASLKLLRMADQGWNLIGH